MAAERWLVYAMPPSECPICGVLALGLWGLLATLHVWMMRAVWRPRAEEVEP